MDAEELDRWLEELSNWLSQHSSIPIYTAPADEPITDDPGGPRWVDPVKEVPSCTDDY